MVRSWESFLVGNCPDAQRVIALAWEPTYHPDHRREFLEGQGYRPLSHEAFVREVGRT